MNGNRAAKTAIQLPLVGIVIAWMLFMGAIYSELFYPWPQWDNNGELLGPEPTVHINVYLFLLGLVAFAILSLLGQRLALRQRELNDGPFAMAAHRFTNLAVILSLVGGAIYAISTFLSAFNTYGDRNAEPLVRIFGVYVPILLATALVVVVLLFAFVFRQDAPDLPHAERDADQAALQRAIGLAYATPVIGTAIAIIFGLVVYDTTRTDLDVWIWVIIQVIIAGSILIGTRFAAQARLAKPLPPRQRQTGAAAVNLNLVLLIVFGVVVNIMAFTFGAAAIENLRNYDSSNYLDIDPISVRWVLEDFLPAIALLLLAEVGIYRSILLRHGEILSRKARSEQRKAAKKSQVASVDSADSSAGY